MDHDFYPQPGSNMCVCGEPDVAHPRWEAAYPDHAWVWVDGNHSASHLSIDARWYAWHSRSADPLDVFPPEMRQQIVEGRQARKELIARRQAGEDQRPEWCICHDSFWMRGLDDHACRHDEIEEREDELVRYRALGSVDELTRAVAVTRAVDAVYIGERYPDGLDVDYEPRAAWCQGWDACLDSIRERAGDPDG